MTITSIALFSGVSMLLSRVFRIFDDKSLLGVSCDIISNFSAMLYYLCVWGVLFTVLIIGLARFRDRDPEFRIWLDAGSAHNAPQYGMVVALIVFIVLLLSVFLRVLHTLICLQS